MRNKNLKSISKSFGCTINIFWNAQQLRNNSTEHIIDNVHVKGM